MATHSSTLAWEIPWTEEPGGLQSMGLQRSQHDLAAKQSKREGNGKSVRNIHDLSENRGVVGLQTGAVLHSSLYRNLTGCCHGNHQTLIVLVGVSFSMLMSYSYRACIIRLKVSWKSNLSLSWALFSCSVMSDSLRPRGLQHARLPCPSLSPRVCSNSGPSNHLTSVALFSSCLQSSTASGSLPMSRLFTSGGQSIGASASVLPMNIQD